VKIRILIILMLFLLVSCYVPSFKVFNLSVKQNDTIWLNGKELVKLTEDNIEVIVNFDQTKHGIISFDLSIANYTDETILISPKEFYCSVTNRLEEERIVNALDPEEMILEYDNQIEKSLAGNKSDNRTELLFSLFDLADDIHNKNKTEDEIKQDHEDRETREEIYNKKEERYFANINRLNSERNLLQNQALRKTTLFPGHKMSGKLFFQVPNSTLNLVLFFPIEERKMKLEYEKIK